MRKEDKTQEKVAQFQMLQQRLRGFEQKERMLLAGIDELGRVKLALNDLEKSKGKAYIPLGANNFVLGNVEDNENILISVGAGVAVKKTRKEAIEIAELRLKEFREETEKVAANVRKISDELMKMQSEIESMRT